MAAATSSPPPATTQVLSFFLEAHLHDAGSRGGGGSRGRSPRGRRGRGRRPPDAGAAGFLETLAGELDRVSCGGGRGEDKGRGRGPSAAGFPAALSRELDRVSAALSDAGTAVEDGARALLRRADAARAKAGGGTEGKDGTAAVAADLRSRARSLSRRSLRLEAQARADAAELRRVAALADRRLPRGTDADAGAASASPKPPSASATVDERLRSKPWTRERGGGDVLAVLSDVYAVARELEARSAAAGGKQQGEDGTWVAPSSFERVTTKYWVREERLHEVLLASVSELPLLVYGRKGGRGSELLRGAGLWSSAFATPITSVYFDGPDMGMYAERLKRSEGARLFRIRWYGPNRPQGEETVFLELKTHHESWIGDASVKERVAIREEDVARLLDVSDGSWDQRLASNLVRRANPSEDAEDIADLANLLLKIRALVCKFRLVPTVRTKYTRVALQSAMTNRCRLTIDRDITVINERCVSSSKSWCIADDDVIPEEGTVKLPYCVYEVKVADSMEGPPAFVANLEEAMAIVEAKKFSKFLSGASVFNSDKVAMLPWWAEEPAFASLYKSEEEDGRRYTKYPRQSASPTRGNLSTNHPPPVGARGLVDNNSDSTEKTDSVSTTDSIEKLKPDRYNNDTEKQPHTLSYEAGTGSSFSYRSASSPRGSLLRRMGKLRNRARNKSVLPTHKQNRIAPKTRLRVEPKSHFANERTFIQWISAALLFITFSQLLYILASQNGVKEANIAGTWMLSMSLFITVYALAIYYRRVHLMTNGKHYGYVDFFGPGVLTACIVAGIVMLIVFTHRANQYSTATTQGVVPVQSVMVHTPGQCVRRSLNGAPMMEMQPSGVLVDEANHLLLIPSLNRIIALKDGLPTEEENSAEHVQIVAMLPGTDDIEALEHNGDHILALSERDKSTRIVALEWANDEHVEVSTQQKLPSHGQTIKVRLNNNHLEDESRDKNASGDFDLQEDRQWRVNYESSLNDESRDGSAQENLHLREVHRWKLSLPGAEGLALLPPRGYDEGFPSSLPAELIVAGDLESGHSIDMYDMDAFYFDATTMQSKVKTVEKKSTMNKRLVSKGLPKIKIGGMQYFEGLLYMLFDNSRVIRAFETRTGAMVHEISLPVAEIGSEPQWEGMRLQRIEEDTNDSVEGGLRRSDSVSSASTLVLHLALDNPAQVWSIRLDEEGAGTGQRWAWPRCAVQ